MTTRDGARHGAGIWRRLQAGLAERRGRPAGPPRPATMRYSAAVALVMAAGVGNWALWEYIRPQGGPLFLVGVIAATWYGGLGPGLLAAALATLGRAIFYTEPLFEPLIETQDLVGAAYFLIVAASLCWLISTRRAADEALHEARAQLELAAELRAANANLRREVDERRRAQEEQRRLESSLRRAETLSAMGSLLAGVAHQVRNPLFGISSVLDAMEARFDGRQEYARYFTALREQTNRLTRLMSELMAYGRPHAADRTPVQLQELLRESVDSCAVLASAADVRLELRSEAAPADGDGNAPPARPGALPALAVDRASIARVLESLIENAIQFSPPGSAVTITARRAWRACRDGEAIEGGAAVGGSAGVECTVRDRGHGFPHEELCRVFEPFYTRRAGGTGLGLAIAQRIVEEHGGCITAANAPDGGAMLRMWLPLQPGAGVGGGASAGLEKAGAAGG